MTTTPIARIVARPIIHAAEYKGFIGALSTVPWMIIFIALILGGVGVLALYSAAGGSWEPWAGRHSLRLLVGIGLMTVIAAIPIWYYRKFAFGGWVLILLTLLAIEVSGTAGGAQRWINIGGFNLQPSEPAKLAVIVLLAAWFHGMNPDRIKKFSSYILPAIFLAIPSGLVLAQPDLGTAVMIAGSAVAVIFVAGIQRWMIVTGLFMAICAIPITWAQLYQYQRDRILIFLNPGADQLGAGYQITQSKIALGSGGLLGKGYLQGSQSRLSYLPEQQTDFIFAIIGEEFGFLGCLVILCLYMGLMFLMARAAIGLNYHFSRMMIMGIVMMMFMYVFVNIGMVTGLLPVVGAPLPLISYGGTALMTVFIAIGLIISAVIYDKDCAE